jgi:hypothetical protein
MRELLPIYLHSVCVRKTSQLMLGREIIAVCSEIHTKHINTPCGQNVEFFNVTAAGTYSDYCAVHIVTTELHLKIQPVPRSKHTPSRL